MAFTREFVRKLAKESGLELPKEFEDGLINEHLSARDAYAEKKLEENKPDEPAPVKDSEEYKKLKKQFEDYKHNVEAEKNQAKESAAVKEYLKGIGIPEKYVESIVKVYDKTGLEFDENGKVKDADGKRATADKGKWADFIPEVTSGGVKTSTPPKSHEAKMSREDIVKIKDPAERRAAIAANMEIFQKGNE